MGGMRRRPKRVVMLLLLSKEIEFVFLFFVLIFSSCFFFLLMRVGEDDMCCVFLFLFCVIKKYFLSLFNPLIVIILFWNVGRGFLYLFLTSIIISLSCIFFTIRFSSRK